MTDEEYEKFSRHMDGLVKQLSNSVDGEPVIEVAQACAVLAVFCVWRGFATPELRKEKLEELFGLMRDSLLRSERAEGSG